MSSLNSTKNFLTGLIFGGLVGVAAAMLYAPQSGDDTRRMIRNTALDAQVKAQEGLRNAQEQINSRVSDIQTRAGEVVGAVADESRKRTERLKEVGREMLAEQSDIMQQQKETLQRAASDALDVIQS